MIPRTSLPARRSVLPRSTKPIRRRNAKRHSKQWLRAYGGVRRVEFVKALPCAACGAIPSEERPSVNAHCITGGTSRKADARFILPLCDLCHHVQHDEGWAKLEIEFGLDRFAASTATDNLWQEYSTGEAA